MSRSHTAKRARPYRGRAVTAVAAAVLAVAPVGGAAGQQALRSPDTVDAASAAGNRPYVAPPPSSIAASAGEAYHDLRSRGS